MRGVPLNEQQIEDILIRYLQGMSVKEISEELDIPVRTIYRNLKKDEVVKRLQEESTYVQNQTRNMLMRDATKYIRNLKEIANKATDVRSKLKANETLLAYIIGSPTANQNITINESKDTNIENELTSILDSIDDNKENDTQEEE